MATDLPDVAAVSIQGSYQGERFVMVEHFRHVAGSYGSVSLADLLTQLAATAVNDTALLHWFSLFDSGAVIDTLYAKTLDTTTPIESTASVNLVGTSGGTDTQAWLAMCVKLTTDLATRRYRGKQYIPGINTGMFLAGDPDHFDTGFVNSVSTEFQEYVTAWSIDADDSLVVLSRKDREANVATPYRVVKGATALGRVSSQRRRRPES